MKKIYLTNDEIALVDDSDYEHLNSFKWRANKGKYTSYAARMSKINGVRRPILMHRFILNTPKGMEVDHIDGDGLNNQRSNLRIATISQNRAHIVRSSKIKKTSRFRGVSLLKKSGKWFSTIQVNKKPINLGSYSDEEQAARAYDAAAIKYFQEFACLNFT